MKKNLVCGLKNVVDEGWSCLILRRRLICTVFNLVREESNEWFCEYVGAHLFHFEEQRIC